MDKVAIIMCGGRGTRLWPLSTDKKPKQFLKIINDDTLLQNTIDRIPKDYKKLFISNVNYKSELENYIRPDDFVIYEPVSRNTGQAIYVACSFLKKKFNKNIKVVSTPCDHIFDNNKFSNILEKGMNNLTDTIITFGIKPTYPETGFGYIQRDNENKVLKFVEKPSVEKAKELIKEECLWNSGVFLFELDYVLNLYEIYNHKSIEHCEKSLENASIHDNIIILSDDYNKSVNISFDYLIMEKISNAYVIEYDGIWSDIGDWKRLRENFIKEDENKIIGKNIENIETKGSLIYSDSGKIVTVGVSDLVVIKYGDNILIVHKDANDLFKKYIQQTN